MGIGTKFRGKRVATSERFREVKKESGQLSVGVRLIFRLCGHVIDLISYHKTGHLL
jgi:hypothetical protein